MPKRPVELPLSTDRKRELAGYLNHMFAEVVKARINQVESKYRKWLNNYEGTPAEKTRSTPFLNASNFMPQLSRMHSDILGARVLGIIFGTRPLFYPRTYLPAPHQWMEDLRMWLEQVVQRRMAFRRGFDSGVMRTVKTGVTTFKMPYVDDTFYLGQSSEHGYAAVKRSGMKIDFRPIPFEDFWPCPLTANCIDECNILFHRIRLTKDEVEIRSSWDKTARDELLKTPQREAVDSAKQESMTEAGIYLVRDVVRPYAPVEAWLRYQLEPGKLFKIVVVFNPYCNNERSILRSYFNPYSRGTEPFADIRILPRDDLYYGYGIPEILEQSQEEQAQIHNSRRDSNTIANIPAWKKIRNANVPNPNTNWYPGCVLELDSMNDIDILQHPIKYNNMIQEEEFLLQLANGYTGIGPPMQATGQGILSGKRGIYNSMGTLAMIAEGNRRLNIYISRLRESMDRIGSIIYDTYHDFAPDDATFKSYGARGEVLKQIFSFKNPEDFNGIFFDIGASDAGANKETDRSNLLLMANTMAAYYRQIMEASGTLVQLPPNNPLHPILLSILDGAKDLADRLLQAFDIGDRARLVPDIRKLLAGSSTAAAQSAEQAGVPSSGDPLSIEGVQSLQQRLATIASRNTPTSGNGGGPGFGGPQ